MSLERETEKLHQKENDKILWFPKIVSSYIILLPYNLPQSMEMEKCSYRIDV